MTEIFTICTGFFSPPSPLELIRARAQRRLDARLYCLNLFLRVTISEEVRDMSISGLALPEPFPRLPDRGFDRANDQATNARTGFREGQREPIGVKGCMVTHNETRRRSFRGVNLCNLGGKTNGNQLQVYASGIEVWSCFYPRSCQTMKGP